jgi:hypothetical protein
MNAPSSEKLDGVAPVEAKRLNRGEFAGAAVALKNGGEARRLGRIFPLY